VKEPNFAIAIDVATTTCTLFCPRLPPAYGIWMGRIKTCDDFKRIYEVDEVKYTDEIESFLEEYVSRGDPKILLNCGENR